MNSKKSSLSSLMLNSWDSNEDNKGKMMESQRKHEDSNSSDDILEFLKKNNEKKTKDSNDSLMGFLEEKKVMKTAETNNPKTIVKTSVNTSLLDLLNKDSNKLRENVIQSKIPSDEQAPINANDLLKIVDSSIPVSNKNVHDSTTQPIRSTYPALDYTTDEKIRSTISDMLDTKLGGISADLQLKLEKIAEIQVRLEKSSKKLDEENKMTEQQNKEFCGFRDSIVSAISNINLIVEKTNENYDKTCLLLNQVGSTKTNVILIDVVRNNIFPY